MSLFLEPWFISILVVVFILGNLATLKYLGKSKLLPNQKKKKSDLDKLLELYRDENSPLSKLHQEQQAQATKGENKEDSHSSSSKKDDLN